MEEEALTVLVVFNGPYNFQDPNDWNVPHMLSLKKQTSEPDNGKSHDGNEDENSGNSSSVRRPKAKKSKLS